jgi:hypothetical protein
MVPIEVECRGCWEIANAIEYEPVLNEGKFIRNLNRKHVAKVFERDSDEDPAYGWRLTNKFKKAILGEGAGYPSVNISAGCCEKCSILLQPKHGTSISRHVVTFDLGKINELFPELGLVAKHRKVEPAESHDFEFESAHPGNPAHYEFFPNEGTMKQIIKLRNKLFGMASFIKEQARELPQECTPELKQKMEIRDQCLSFKRNVYVPD